MTQYQAKQQRKKKWIPLVAGGELSIRQAAKKLGVSVYCVWDLKNRYKEKGRLAFVNGHKGLSYQKKKYSDAFRAELVALYKTHWTDAPFSTFCEALETFHGIKVPYNAVRKILLAAGLKPPRSWSTKERQKHKRRDERPREGELVQMDASKHDWFMNGTYATLHGGVDDATHAVYNEFKRVQSQTYECSGYLINSLAGEIEGYGRATVTLKDGVAEIRFSARIHTNNMTSTFSWGLNRDLLRTLIPDLPYITPVSTNSNLLFFAATGAAYIDNMGYGAMASATNQFWTPARMYQTDGGTGIWWSDQFPVNSYITGVVYGSY